MSSTHDILCHICVHTYVYHTVCYRHGVYISSVVYYTTLSRLDLQSELPSANTGLMSTAGAEQVSIINYNNM